MKRRDLLGWLSGFTASAALAPLTAADRLAVAEAMHAPSSEPPGVFLRRQAAVVALLADTILPATDTPGAIDVQVPQFIEHLTANWFSDQERAELLTGLEALERGARERSGVGLMESVPADRIAFLTELDLSQGPRGRGTAEQAFARIQELTVYGYLTSKRIQTELLKTVILPGRFEGCIPAGTR